MIHKFVDSIPREIESDTIYISIKYGTAIHKCCCGCSNEVVTPLSPTDWKLIFDGESISLSPSIGNWNFECQSHYWIENNKILWAQQWSEEEIRYGRINDRLNKANYYNEKSSKNVVDNSESKKSPTRLSKSFWRFLKKLFH